MENYIVINGKKAELTEEQLRQLGIEVEKKTPFKRVPDGKSYYYIEYSGEVRSDTDYRVESDDKCYAAANYCTDPNLMQQRAWHETLSRLLWRYSMEHKAERQGNRVWGIRYFRATQTFGPLWDFDTCTYMGEILFDTKKIAQNAIDEIVKPFLAEHPDFKW